MKAVTDLKTNWGVFVFPGSNCDHDGIDALSRICGQNAREIWHKQNLLDDLDAVLLPGGFSYGDYLRSGAIARFSPVMENLKHYANNDKLVIGICNGFQILTEAGLLPGVLMKNIGLRFICREVHLRVERTDTPFTSAYTAGQVITIPIAHNEGNYYLPPGELEELEKSRQVVFRYCNLDGEITAVSNPNGSANNIAGIINLKGNVLGMMPHPERRCDPLLGQPDGEPLFRSMIEHIANRKFDSTAT